MLGNYRSQDAPQIVELLFYHQRNENSSGERPTDALRRRRIATKVLLVSVFSCLRADMYTHSLHCSYEPS